MRAIQPIAGALLLVSLPSIAPAQRTEWMSDSRRVAALKSGAVRAVDSMHTLTQQMVDQIFSFGELGFQEMETSRYLVDLLKQHGFTVEMPYAGIPTAFVARWGAGQPVIALGTDIDGIPQASQFPGVACHAPMIEGAPGHGEGHNSGMAVIVTAALAVKDLMQREKMPGTLVIWPGVAEELVGTKAYFVRQGLFRDADAVIFVHVGRGFSTSWGEAGGTGLVSAIFSFEGETAHAAGAPWRGRSALDAVELMDIGWNFKREHLRPSSRSHSVIVDGGDQPNVVPRTASIWYYFRETEYPRIKQMFEYGQEIAKGAATMTGTTLKGIRVLGSAWPRHFNKPLAEMMQRNIERVGMPTWTEADQTLARAVQKEVSSDEKDGLKTKVDALEGPVPDSLNRGGGSDDIGDVSWVAPTITLRYPSNIPGLPGHNWADAISMATPIAHKGATAGAKATAMTVIDVLTKPALVRAARVYFDSVQTKTQKYEPLIRPDDRPATELNTEILAKYREQMRKYYYDPAKPGTYLEQLGVRYPTMRTGDGCPRPTSIAVP